jgi:2-oxoacid:acceptor oxidoreductase delta subunit (pyruvate/2-ketoisovalerate family)
MIKHLKAEPGSSRKNKTGSWRTGTKPKFLQKKCVACKMCLLVCPEGCISGDKKNTYHCDYSYCKGCGNCVAVCPVKDIEMVGEKDKA